MRYTTSTRPTKIATMRLHVTPVTNMGMRRIIVFTGDNCK